MSLSDFIYIKEKSLSVPLTNKIIEAYDNLCISNGMNEHNITDIISILTHTEKDKKLQEEYLFLLKLKKILDKELREHFFCYLLDLSTKYDMQITDMHNIFRKFDTNYDTNIDIDYIITNRNQNITKNIQIENKIVKRYTTRVNSIESLGNLCKFIWFLTDYTGEIKICNKIFLSPKRGTFIMYPISWTYPVIEKINKEKDIYVLYGYIYYTPVLKAAA